MRRLLLAVLFAASSSAAGEWVRVGESGALTVYVDPNTISRADGMVKVATLHDHKTPSTNVRGWLYRSVKTQVEFDCPRERLRPLYSALYSGHMGGGLLVGNEPSGTWTPVAPESVAENVLKLACGKK